MYDLSVVELVLTTLFVAEVLEVLKHGNIFENYRAKLEAGAYGNPDRFHVQLLSCMFCLSVWVTGVVVLFMVLRPFLPSVVTNTVSFFILVGALTRLSNILHDVIRLCSRTPNSGAVREANMILRGKLNERGERTQTKET